jgi:hypothetical protein
MTIEELDYLEREVFEQNEQIDSIKPILENYKIKSKDSKNYIPKVLTYLNPLKRYTRRLFKIKVTDYLPPSVLGMTDCEGNIWLKRLYGYLKEHVLKHEINHNLFPNASEYQIRKITETGYPSDLCQFEFVYV